MTSGRIWRARSVTWVSSSSHLIEPSGQVARWPGGQRQFVALGLGQPHLTGIVQRTLREGAAVRHRIALAGDPGGLLDGGLDRVGHALLLRY